jgi:hypothetical protein
LFYSKGFTVDRIPGGYSDRFVQIGADDSSVPLFPFVHPELMTFTTKCLSFMVVQIRETTTLSIHAADFFSPIKVRRIGR